jgi:hypothetical protein
VLSITQMDTPMAFIRRRSILNRISFLAAAALAGALALSAQTVTAPAVNETIKAADDFATLTFQDPWDMNQMTDLGWYTYSVDQPVSCLTNIAFSGGIFSATTSGTTAACPSGNLPNFWLLDPIAATSAQIGKVGTVFPIDSTKYRRFVIRVNLSGPPGGNQSHLIWNIYGPQETPARQTSTSNAFSVHPGQWIYSVDLTTLGIAGGTTWAASNPVNSLRVDPVFAPNINFYQF